MSKYLYCLRVPPPSYKSFNGVLFLQFWLGLQGDQGKKNLEMSLAIGGCLRVFSVVRAGPAPASGGGRREVGREKGRERGGGGRDQGREEGREDRIV